MVTDFLEKLQKKDKATKRLLLWVLTGVFMVVIISLWLSLGWRWENSKNFPQKSPFPQAQEKASVTKLGNLFGEVKKDYLKVKRNLTSVLESFFKGKEVSPEIISSPPAPSPPAQRPTPPPPSFFPKLPESD